MQCFTCNKFTGVYKTDKKICGSCREEVKIDLVLAVLKLDPIYLSESNRNKYGRKPKLTANETYDIKCSYQNPPGNRKISMRDLAKKYNISVGTVSRIVHS